MQLSINQITGLLSGKSPALSWEFNPCWIEKNEALIISISQRNGYRERRIRMPQIQLIDEAPVQGAFYTIEGTFY
jgi:hypothetical protein